MQTKLWLLRTIRSLLWALTSLCSNPALFTPTLSNDNSPLARRSFHLRMSLKKKLPVVWWKLVLGPRQCFKNAHAQTSSILVFREGRKAHCDIWMGGKIKALVSFAVCTAEIHLFLFFLYFLFEGANIKFEVARNGCSTWHSGRCVWSKWPNGPRE